MGYRRTDSGRDDQGSLKPRSSVAGRSRHLRWLLLGSLALLGLAAALPKPDIAAVPAARETVTPTWTGVAKAIAQTPSSSAAQPLQEGRRISINGRSTSAAWGQWAASGNSAQPRIAISDSDLPKVLGIDLLNTDSLSQQPVQWFAQGGVALPTRLTGQHRYLDITDFARSLGWTTSVNGDTLQIQTPTAQVINVREGRHSWGDRIVLDVDGPIPFEMQEQAQVLTLSLDAAIAPALGPAIAKMSAAPSSGTKPSATPANNRRFRSITSIKPNGRQTLLQLRLPADSAYQFFTLANPNRIVIDVRRDALPNRSIAWAPGVRWRQQMVSSGRRSHPVVWLEVDLRQRGLSLQPITSSASTIAGIEPLLRLAQQSRAIAAINGGFFNRNNKLPLGAIRQEGRWLSGPILNRGAIAWDSQGNIQMGRLSLQEVLSTSSGQRFPITTLNSGYIQAGFARYTPTWGPYTPLSDNEILIFVEGDRVLRQQTAGKAGSGTVTIPANGYLLVARSNRTGAAALPAGTTLTLTNTTNPSSFGQYPNIMGGGPLLIQNSQIVLNAAGEQFNANFTQGAAARSALGQTANGTLLIVATHSGGETAGPTLPEMAQIMRNLGAVNALNLDGGSSTTLYLGGQLLNKPPQSAARVHNGLGLFWTP